MFPLPLRVLDGMVRVAVEAASLFFEIHQVEPVLSIQVIVTHTVLTVVIQVEKVVEQQEVVSRVLTSKVNRR